jgi:hypothetical protein
MAYVFGTSTNYRTFADIIRRVAIGTSLQTVDSVAGGGTGYTVGDILTISGGTSVIAATLEVLTAPAGVIATVRIRNAGLYTATPGDPVSVTGGTGTGATFNLTFDTNGWIDRRTTGSPNAAVSATVGAGGTGYTVGDILTISGGTFSRAATFQVATAPAGVVGTVTLVDWGDYTTTPGNPAATTGGTGTGCTLNVTYGNAEREIILEGEGSGSDEIYVGYRSFFDASSGARNLCVNGFTGFSAGLTYETQPGRSPGLDTASSGGDLGGCYVLLTNSTVTWWISVSPRRIVGVARTGTCYSSFYMGFLNPFATGGEWPYPICVGATTSERFRLSSSSAISSSGIADPVRDSTADVGPMLVRTADGQWNTVYNSTDGSPRSQHVNGCIVFPGGNATSINVGTGDDWFSLTAVGKGTDFIPASGNPGTQTIRIIPTENGSSDYYIRFPCTITSFDPASGPPLAILGELDGVFWFEAATVVVAENRLTDGSDRFMVFQSGVRSENWALWCLKES